MTKKKTSTPAKSKKLSLKKKTLKDLALKKGPAGGARKLGPCDCFRSVYS